MRDPALITVVGGFTMRTWRSDGDTIVARQNARTGRGGPTGAPVA